MIVARGLRRKTKMMMTTRMPARMSVSSASRMERRTNRAPSNPTSMRIPGGSASWMPGSSARIASDTWIRLAFDWRTTPMATAELPRKRSTVRSFSGPNSTRATSLSFTSCPFWLATVRLPNSSGVLSSPRERTVNSRRSDSIRPAGISTLRLRTAAWMSCTVRPWAASRLGESQMRIE